MRAPVHPQPRWKRARKLLDEPCGTSHVRGTEANRYSLPQSTGLDTPLRAGRCGAVAPPRVLASRTTSWMDGSGILVCARRPRTRVRAAGMATDCNSPYTLWFAPLKPPTLAFLQQRATQNRCSVTYVTRLAKGKPCSGKRRISFDKSTCLMSQICTRPAPPPAATSVPSADTVTADREGSHSPLADAVSSAWWPLPALRSQHATEQHVVAAHSTFPPEPPSGKNDRAVRPSLL